MFERLVEPWQGAASDPLMGAGDGGLGAFNVHSVPDSGNLKSGTSGDGGSVTVPDSGKSAGTGTGPGPRARPRTT